MATQQEVIERQQEKAAMQRREDIEWMLQSERGRRILFDLVEGTRSFEVSFTGNSGSYFNDGRKSVGLEYFHEIMGISPDSFTLMWNEHNRRLQEQARELEESEEI